MAKSVVHPIFEQDVAHVDDLDHISYALGCIDEASGQRGTFAYDEYLFSKGIGMWSISPVFQDVEGFYAWAKSRGFLYHRCGCMLMMSRNFE